MRSGRRCSRSGCGQDSVATLTYVYSDSTAVLGPLATYAEPHSYDLCEGHAARLTAPRGWEVVRLQVEDHGPVGPSHDDLLALVEAVREAAREPGHRATRAGRLPASSRDRSGLLDDGGARGEGAGHGPPPGYGRGVGRRGHLRVLGPVVDSADDAGDGTLDDQTPGDGAPGDGTAGGRTSGGRGAGRGGRDEPFDGWLVDP